MKKLFIAITFTAAVLVGVLIYAYAAQPEIKIENETIDANALTYQVSFTEPLSGALILAVYDDKGGLCDVSVEKSTAPKQKWTISATSEQEKGLSKITFWDAADKLTPWTEMVSSSWSKNKYEHLTQNSTIGDLLNHPAFAGFAEQMLPYDGRDYNEDMPLSNISSLMVYHSHVNPENSIAAINRLIDDVNSGYQVFYDFYTEEEKAADPSKKDTGLFFYRGEPGAPFAVQCAGGAFSYVGSLHESMPHCLEVNKHGYNAFAIKYRVGSEQKAAEDLAAAISFIIEHADELGVNPNGYSVWGGSAGGRMAADMGTYGTAYWGGHLDSRPATVVMAYTGRSNFSENDPPTFAVVGENYAIANPRIMEQRINGLKTLGIDAEFHLYPNLGHGFGIGLRTSAEGWVDDAVSFWEKHM